jgi:hypothetical protein
MPLGTIQAAGSVAIDTHVRENAATTNYGTDVGMDTLVTAGSRRFALVKFDVSAYSGKTVTAATLSLYNESTSTSAKAFPIYNIRAANSQWTEAGAQWNFAVGTTVRWAGDTDNNGGTNAGCSVPGTDYDTTAIGTVSYAANDVADTENKGVLATSAVQAWVDGSNYGLLVYPTGTSGFYWRTSDNSQATGPKLVINYDEPAGGPGTVTVAEGLVANTGDAVVIRGITPLTVSEGAVANLGDAVIVRHITPIAIAEGLIANTGDEVVIRHITPISVAEGTVANTGDACVVTFSQEPSGEIEIEVSEGFVANTGDACVLRALYPLVVSEGNVANTGDAVTLNAISPITVAEGLVGNTGDAVTLSFTSIGSISITVSEGNIANTGDAVVLRAITPISIAEGNVTNIGDAVSINAITPLSVAQGFIANTGDAVTLSFTGVSYVVTVTEGFINNTGDPVILNAISPISVGEGMVINLGDIVTLSLFNLILHGARELYTTNQYSDIDVNKRSNYKTNTRNNYVVSTRETGEADD